MKVVIIEDDINFSIKLKKMITQFLNNHLKQYSIEIINNDFSHIYNLELYDLIFVDIELQETNGIDIIKTLREKSMIPIVVFISSHEEFVFHSFQLQALSFIRKNHLEKDMNVLYSLLSNKLNHYTKFVTIHYKGQQRIVNQKDILYLESHAHDTIIVTHNNDYTIRCTFEEIINQLGLQYFVQIQKSIYISLLHIKEIHNNHIILDDLSSFTLSKIYKKQFHENYKRFLLWI